MSKFKKIAVFLGRGEESPEFPENSQLELGNARFWDGRYRQNCDSVYAPSFPKIEDVYQKSGRQVYRPEGMAGKTEKETEEINQDSPTGDETSASNSDWRDLSWPKMRSLATKLTDEPVKSKEDAIEILEKAESEGNMPQ